MKKNETRSIGNQIALRWKTIFRALTADFKVESDQPISVISNTSLFFKRSKFLLLLALLASCLSVTAQDLDQGALLIPIPHNYAVKRAIEIESLFPTFFTGGYHFAVGYWYKKFRVRVSVINGVRTMPKRLA